MPIGATNSAVISAACHILHDGHAEENVVDENITEQPLHWGVTIPGGPYAVGHLAFIDKEVLEPEYDALYAGAARVDEVYVFDGRPI
jgi:hypothetical protein